MNLEGAQLLENPTHIATCGEITFAGVSPHYFACPPIAIKEPNSTEIKEPNPDDNNIETDKRYYLISLQFINITTQKNSNMKLVKVNLLVISVLALLCLLLLIWNESSVSCDATTLKVVETMFSIVSVYTMREQAKISWK